MGKVMLSINLSLDGFADHTVAVAADDELHDFFSGLLDLTEVAIFGRVTYELMESYWPRAHEDPSATKGMLDFATKFNAIPKVVFSKTLKSVMWNNTRLVRENLVEQVVGMKHQPGKHISLGGISLSQELMRRRLIDEYWLVVHPVVVGRGRRLFDGLDEIINLRLVDTRFFRSGAVVLHYQDEAGKANRYEGHRS